MYLCIEFNNQNKIDILMTDFSKMGKTKELSLYQ